MGQRQQSGCRPAISIKREGIDGVALLVKHFRITRCEQNGLNKFGELEEMTA
ncbi:hypothetical protein JOD01_003041 [Brevibacillus fulvus]|uniref:Uncharacterized protein n=1 Tax=Brevibacillus fulvus TaxID=1125967 RepID=A0A938Y4E6_9BACL|nr:hypothetical protein [Brevibacillus fulvus]